MRLSKKTFLYSIILAAVMVAFITGYFVFMLPSLYVDYVTDSNFDSVVRIQKKLKKKQEMAADIRANCLAAGHETMPQ